MNGHQDDTQWIERLDQLLSILRHELGNDLHALRLTLDHLRGNFGRLDDTEKIGFLDRLSEILMRQEKQVSALEAYLAVDIEPSEAIDASGFLQRMAHRAASVLENTSIVLNCRISGDRCAIWANGDMLEAVLINLIENAMAALSKTTDPRIELDVQGSGRFVMIRVSDNGPGIDSQHADKIFIPFFSTQKGKVGMGLPLARKLLSKMDGEISVVNLEGHGAEVRLWLKRANTEAQ